MCHAAGPMRPEAGWGFATELDDVSGQVGIVGVGEAQHTKAAGRTTTDMAASAVERALADAGLEPEDIDGIMTVPAMAGQFDEVAFRARFGTTQDIWSSTRGGGMVWAATAPHEAAMALN